MLFGVSPGEEEEAGVYFLGGPGQWNLLSMMGPGPGFPVGEAVQLVKADLRTQDTCREVEENDESYDHL